jgi:osmotically-inducible protein OsmY
MKSTFLRMIAVASALGIAGCGGATNSNNTNTNTNTNTARVAVSPSPTVDCKNGSMTREEYEKNKAKCEGEKGSSTIGQGINDSWIWFKTRAALATTSDLRDSTINVDVVNDVITLKGTVGTAAQKASAEKVAKGIEGQKGVKNELKVAPADSVTNMSSGNSNAKSTNTNTKK